jgi:hypothetical protein
MPLVTDPNVKHQQMESSCPFQGHLVTDYNQGSVSSETTPNLTYREADGFRPGKHVVPIHYRERRDLANIITYISYISVILLIQLY